MQVLYNVAHQRTCIQSLTGGALRVLRVCETDEDAKSCLELWSKECPDLEVRISPLRHWRILSQDLLTVDEQKEHFANLLIKYSESRKEAFEETQRRAHNREAPQEEPLKDTSTQEPLNTQELPKSHRTESMAWVPPVPGHLVRESQKFVGLAILPDILKENRVDQEPAFQIVCVGTTEEEIASKLKQYSDELVDPESKQVPMVFSWIPMACVSMQEFIKPAWVSSVETKRVSRDPRITEIREALQVSS